MLSTDLQPRQPAPVLRACGWREQERRSEPAPPILNWELELGDCLVFVRHSKTPPRVRLLGSPAEALTGMPLQDSRIVHSAPPVSDSAPRRRAFATRWAGEDAHYTIACDPLRQALSPPTTG